jgi:hypothetical protein
VPSISATPTEGLHRPPGALPALLARVSETLAAGRTEGQRYLLLLRFTLINMAGLALLGAVAMQGWIGTILAVDDTHICKLLFVLFTIGLVWSARRAGMLSNELNALDRGDWQGRSRVATFMRDIRGRGGETRAALAMALRLKLAHRIAPVRQMAGSLVLIGLIGTVIGFIIALSGIDRSAVSDASQIGPMVATLLRGMSMALFKTLIGSVLNVWLMINYRLLESGAAHLVTRAIETGERHADA